MYVVLPIKPTSVVKTLGGVGNLCSLFNFELLVHPTVYRRTRSISCQDQGIECKVVVLGLDALDAVPIT